MIATKRCWLRPTEAVRESVDTSAGRVQALLLPRPTESGEDVRNDDCALVADLGRGAVVLAVADGAGGHRLGGEAAACAIQTLHDEIPGFDGNTEVLQALVIAAFDHAAMAVRDLGSDAITTLSVALVCEGIVRTLHAGDSPIYVFGQRGRRKWQTMDHTPVGLGIEGGWIEVAEGREHPERHLVTNVLGTDELRIEMGPRIPLSRFDNLVLASDGLSDNLSAAEVIELNRMGAPAAAAEAVERLLTLRMAGQDPHRNGKPDDCTVLHFRPSNGRGRMISLPPDRR